MLELVRLICTDARAFITFLALALIFSPLIIFLIAAYRDLRGDHVR